MEALGVAPKQATGTGTEAVLRLGGRLVSIPQDLSQLRNQVGDGHGALSSPMDVELRHGRLAVRAAIAWCAFMLETLDETKRS
jgi:hypothetical protein